MFFNPTTLTYKEKPSAFFTQQALAHSFEDELTDLPFFSNYLPHIDIGEWLRNCLFTQDMQLKVGNVAHLPLPNLTTIQLTRIKDLLLKPIQIADRQGLFTFEICMAGLLEHMLRIYPMAGFEITGSSLYHILGREWLQSYFKALNAEHLFSNLPAEFLLEKTKKPLDLDLHLHVPEATIKQLQDMQKQVVAYLANRCTVIPEAALDKTKLIIESCFSKYIFINKEGNCGFCFSFGGPKQTDIDLVFIKHFKRTYIFDHDAWTLKISGQDLNGLMHNQLEGLNLHPTSKIGQGWSAPALHLAKRLHSSTPENIDLRGAATILSAYTKGALCSSQALEIELVKKLAEALTSNAYLTNDILIKSFASHLPPGMATSFCFNMYHLLLKHNFSALKFDAAKILPEASAESELKRQNTLPANLYQFISEILLKQKALPPILPAKLVVYSYLQVYKKSHLGDLHLTEMHYSDAKEPALVLSIKLSNGTQHLHLSFDLLKALQIVEDQHQNLEDACDELPAYFFQGKESFAQIAELENVEITHKQYRDELITQALRFTKNKALQLMGFCLLCDLGSQGTASFLPELGRLFIELFTQTKSLQIRKSLLYRFLSAYQNAVAEPAYKLQKDELIDIEYSISNEVQHPIESIGKLCQTCISIRHRTLAASLYLNIRQAVKGLLAETLYSNSPLDKNTEILHLATLARIADKSIWFAAGSSYDAPLKLTLNWINAYLAKFYRFQTSNLSAILSLLIDSLSHPISTSNSSLLLTTLIQFIKSHEIELNMQEISKRLATHRPWILTQLFGSSEKDLENILEKAHFLINIDFFANDCPAELSDSIWVLLRQGLLKGALENSCLIAIGKLTDLASQKSKKLKTSSLVELYEDLSKVYVDLKNPTEAIFYLKLILPHYVKASLPEKVEETFAQAFNCLQLLLEKQDFNAAEEFLEYLHGNARNHAQLSAAWQSLAIALSKDSPLKAADIYIKKHKLIAKNLLITSQTQLCFLSEHLISKKQTEAYHLAFTLIRLYGHSSAAFWQNVASSVQPSCLEVAVETFITFTVDTKIFMGPVWLNLLQMMEQQRPTLFIHILPLIDLFIASLEKSESCAQIAYILATQILNLLQKEYIPKNNYELVHTIFEKIEVATKEILDTKQRENLLLLYVETFIKVDTDQMFSKVFAVIQTLNPTNAQFERVLTLTISRFATLKKDPKDYIASILQDMILNLNVPSLSKMDISLLLNFFASHTRLYLAGNVLLEKIMVALKNGNPALLNKCIVAKKSICNLNRQLAFHSHFDLAIKHLASPSFSLLLNVQEIALHSADIFLLLSKKARMLKDKDLLSKALNFYAVHHIHKAYTPLMEDQVFKELAALLLNLYFDHQNLALYNEYFFQIISTFCSKHTNSGLSKELNAYKAIFLQPSMLTETGFESGLACIKLASAKYDALKMQHELMAGQKVPKKNVAGTRDMKCKNLEKLFLLWEAILSQLNGLSSDKIQDQAFILQHFFTFVPLLLEFYPDKHTKIHSIIYQYAFRYVLSEHKFFEMHLSSVFKLLKLLEVKKLPMSAAEVIELKMLIFHIIEVDVNYKPINLVRSFSKVICQLASKKSGILTHHAITLLIKLQKFVFINHLPELELCYNAIFSALLANPFYQHNDTTNLELLFNQVHLIEDLRSNSNSKFISSLTYRLVSKAIDTVIAISQHHKFQTQEVTKYYHENLHAQDDQTKGEQVPTDALKIVQVSSYMHYLSLKVAQIAIMPSMQDPKDLFSILHKVLPIAIANLQQSGSPLFFNELLAFLFPICHQKPPAKQLFEDLAKTWFKAVTVFKSTQDEK